MRDEPSYCVSHNAAALLLVVDAASAVLLCGFSSDGLWLQLLPPLCYSASDCCLSCDCNFS